MSCEIELGRPLTCKDAVGGIQAIYFVNYGSAEFTMDATTEMITAIWDATLGTGNTVNVFKYDLKGTGNNLTQNVNSDRNTGTTYFEQVLAVTLKKMEASTNKEMKLLAYGNPQIIVHDNQGKAWLVGKVHGADLSGGTIVTGDAFGDLNGYTMEFTGMEQLAANEITGSTVTNPFADSGMEVVVIETTIPQAP